MASPLTVARNNYHKNPKASAIYTPPGVAGFLFDILKRSEFVRILDPAIGSGRLTDPWRAQGHYIMGCDIKDSTANRQEFICKAFEETTTRDFYYTPDLVLCNPPFNGAPGKQLYPEVFLRHIFDLWGPQTPTVMFAPMGMRLNQRRKSTRWRWLRDCGAEITSIISLPLDVFPDVEFHAEILIFNVSGIQPHYFLPEEALQ